MSLIEYAKSEFNRNPLPDDSEYDMDREMRNHILHMIEEFSKEGHSGFSANYAISLLTRLLSYKPLSPLTGEDDEWIDHGDVLQNKRYSAVFKDKDSGKAYDIEGKVFWEWYENEDGEKIKSYFTSRDSRVYIDFPYSVPEKPIYEERVSDEEGQS